MYVNITCCVGRFLCGKPQDVEFGESTAESLSDIHDRLLALRTEIFPAVHGDQGLELMTKWAAKALPAASKPSEQKPVAKAAASSAALPMPVLHEVDAVTGRRDGAWNKLAEQGLARQSKVEHPLRRGVYTIEDVCGTAGAETIRLAKFADAVSVEDLWGALEEKQVEADAAAAEAAAADFKGRSRAAAAGAMPKAGARQERRATEVTAAKPSPAAEPAADVPSDNGAAEVATEQDYSFQDEHMIPIDKFLKDWEISSNKVKGFAFDKDLPAERAKAKEKSLKTSLYALVMAALIVSTE
jgi:hypothetical protein